MVFRISREKLSAKSTEELRKKIEAFKQKCKEKGIKCCFKQSREFYKAEVAKAKQAAVQNAVNAAASQPNGAKAQPINGAPATNNEVVEGTKAAENEEQRKLVIQALKKKDQILDSRNLSNMYRSIAGNPEVIKEVITARIQSTIDMMRELKGKPLNKGEMYRVFTDMKLIRLACEQDRVDLSTIIIDRNVVEGKAHKEPKSLEAAMTEMAQICAENGNYETTKDIDNVDAGTNVTSDIIEEKLENASKGDSEALKDANDFYKNADSETQRELEDEMAEANKEAVGEVVETAEQDLPDEDRRSFGEFVLDGAAFIMGTVAAVEAIREFADEATPVMELKLDSVGDNVG